MIEMYVVDESSTLTNNLTDTVLRKAALTFEIFAHGHCHG